MLKQEAGGRRPVRLCPDVPFIFSTACCARTAIPLLLGPIEVPAGTSVDGSGSTWSRVLRQVNEGFTTQKQLALRSTEGEAGRREQWWRTNSLA